MPARNNTTFPWKLHDLLALAEKRGQEHIIAWCPGGTTFNIHDPELFASSGLMREFFKHNKFLTFKRMILKWGFRRIKDANDPRGGGNWFVHPMFLKGNPNLCNSMVPNNPHIPAGEISKQQTSRTESPPPGTAVQKLSFPEKLYEMLKLAEKNAHELVVCWCAGGTAFRVSRPEEFARGLLHAFFEQKTYEAFVKELYNWGFEQIKDGKKNSIRGAFFHPMFLKKNPSLCSSMSRKIPPKRGLPPNAKKVDEAVVPRPQTHPLLILPLVLQSTADNKESSSPPAQQNKLVQKVKASSEVSSILRQPLEDPLGQLSNLASLAATNEESDERIEARLVLECDKAEYRVLRAKCSLSELELMRARADLEELEIKRSRAALVLLQEEERILEQGKLDKQSLRVIQEVAGLQASSTGIEKVCNL